MHFSSVLTLLIFNIFEENASFFMIFQLQESLDSERLKKFFRGSYTFKTHHQQLDLQVKKKWRGEELE